MTNYPDVADHLDEQFEGSGEPFESPDKTANWSSSTACC